jgi:hypothetical protein
MPQMARSSVLGGSHEKTPSLSSISRRFLPNLGFQEVSDRFSGQLNLRIDETKHTRIVDNQLQWLCEADIPSRQPRQALAGIDPQGQLPFSGER